MSKRVAIGIDLGTTYSCVGIFRNGEVDIVHNDMGYRITPSYVSFTSEEILAGNSAKEDALVNSANTVFENKRLIGRRFADATVQEDMKQWPFEVLDDNGAPKIRVQYMKEEKVFSPEQISALLLKSLKKDAEAFVGEEVHDAVITVPAYFNDSQRQATIDAGKLAGLHVLNIINEPTAAAIAYGFKNRSNINQEILVFDLGGGTFDVSVLSIANRNYTVRAVGGDTHLGGGDFDSRLVDHFLAMIKRKHNIDLSGNNRAMGRLRRACETAKIKLSKATVATVNVDCLFDATDFRASITRKRFEELCSDLFKKTVEHVANVLDGKDIDKDEIQEVILVGGSSRIPKIQELLSVYFNDKKLNATIHPDEAVAYGAAVKAALASGEHTIEEITLSDVVPLSLGRSKRNGEMVTFIKKNSRIPITVVSNNWTTVYDYQDSVKVMIYEGERKRAVDNNFLGSFKYNIGEIAKAGVPNNTYTFHVDENGILHVSGENEKTKCNGGVSITSNKGRLTKEEIERMVQEVKTFSAVGELSQDAGPAKEALESYCIDQKEAAKGKWDDNEISEADYDSVVSWCDQVLEWLDDNNQLSKWNYDEKLSELRGKCSSVLLR